jgi:hypothetical protein
MRNHAVLPDETMLLKRCNSVELNAQNDHAVGSIYSLSAPDIFKPEDVILTSFIVMSIKATPM